MTLKLMEKVDYYNFVLPFATGLFLSIGFLALIFFFSKFHLTVDKRYKRREKRLNWRTRYFYIFSSVFPSDEGDDSRFKKLINYFIQKIKKKLINVLVIVFLFLICYVLLGTNAYPLSFNFEIWSSVDGFEFLKNFKNKFCLQAESYEEFDRKQKLIDKIRTAVTIQDAEYLRRVNDYKNQMTRFLLILQDVSDKSVFDYWFNIYIVLERMPTWMHKATYLEEVLSKPLPGNCNHPEYKIIVEILEQAHVRCLRVEQVVIDFTKKLKKFSDYP